MFVIMYILSPPHIKLTKYRNYILQKTLLLVLLFMNLIATV